MKLLLLFLVQGALHAFHAPLQPRSLHLYAHLTRHKRRSEQPCVSSSTRLHAADDDQGGGEGDAMSHSQTVDVSYQSDESFEAAKRIVDQKREELFDAVSDVTASHPFGLGAPEKDVNKIGRLVSEFESSVQDAQMTPNLYEDLADVSGLWKLIYSSGFASGSLGGMRPGPRLGAAVPFRVKRVYQRIGSRGDRIDNIVELQYSNLVQSIPLPKPPLPTLVLYHEAQMGDPQMYPSRFRIFQDRTTISPRSYIDIALDPSFDAETAFSRPRIRRAPEGVMGGEGLEGFLMKNLPDLDLPLGTASLPIGQREARSGFFDVIYADGQKRVTRGDRGEIRLFVKA